MSMQTVEYQGYGVDLGNFVPKKGYQQELWDFLMTNLDDLDACVDCSDAYVASSCNSLSFDSLVYLPAIMPISETGKPVKTYTTKEANQELVKAIEGMLLAIVNGTPDDMDVWNEWMNKPLDHQPSLEEVEEIMPAVEQFVDKFATESYDEDWTDEV